MTIQRVLSLSAATLAAAALPLYAQSTRQVAGHSQSGTGNFGESVTQLGDWNADGVSEYAVGSPFATAGGPLAGQVRIFNGLDGLVLRTINGSGVSSCGSGGGTAGDQLGTDVIDIADLDNDGKRELLATRPGAPRTTPCQAGHGGFLIIHSNPATPDFSFTSPTQSGLGAACARQHDHGLRHAGEPDVLGQHRPRTAAFAANAAGDQVFVFNILGTQLQTITGAFGSGFGSSLAPLNQPGQLHALVIGAPLANNFDGRIDVVDSAGFVVRTLLGVPTFGEQLGQVVASGGDVDGDGDQDFLALSSVGNQIKISDRNGNLTKRTIVLPAGVAATALDVMPDMQGNGHAEVLVGAAQQNQSWVYFGGPDAGSVSVSNPCSIGTANLPTLGLSADPIIGTSPSFGQFGATPNMPGVFYVGVVDAVGTVIPPGPCRLHLLLTPTPIGVPFTTDVNGSWFSAPMTMPFPVGARWPSRRSPWSTPRLPRSSSATAST